MSTLLLSYNRRPIISILNVEIFCFIGTIFVVKTKAMPSHAEVRRASRLRAQSVGDEGDSLPSTHAK